LVLLGSASHDHCHLAGQTSHEPVESFGEMRSETYRDLVQLIEDECVLAGADEGVRHSRPTHLIADLGAQVVYEEVSLT
jgi:hypothetical protein